VSVVISRRGVPIPRAIASIIALILLCSPSARAAILAPGNTNYALGTTAAQRPELAGTLLADTLTPLQVTGTGGAVLYSGTFESRVTRSSTTGALIFDYQLTTDSGINYAVDDIAQSGFANRLTDVEYRSDLSGTRPPKPISRSAGAGDIITWNFSDPVDAGHASRFDFTYTDAPDFDFNGVTTFTAHSGATRLTFSTTSYQPIPEPALFLPLAALSLIVRGRTRRRVARM
jgi:hypothetical protein